MPIFCINQNCPSMIPALGEVIVGRWVIEDLVAAATKALDFISDEYADARSQAMEGEHVSAEAREVRNQLINALAGAYEANRRIQHTRRR